MLIKAPPAIVPSEITPEQLFESRRKFIKSALATSAAALLPGRLHAETGKYEQVPVGPYSAKRQVSDVDDVASYTNYGSSGISVLGKINGPWINMPE